MSTTVLKPGDPVVFDDQAFEVVAVFPNGTCNLANYKDCVLVCDAPIDRVKPLKVSKFWKINDAVITAVFVVLASIGIAGGIDWLLHK